MQRTAATAALCVLGGLLLVIPSVSSDSPAAQNRPLYSGWQAISPGTRSAPLPGEVKLGSFQLQRPAGELFLRGLGAQLYETAAAVPPSRRELEAYLKDYSRRHLISNAAPPQTFRGWLQARNKGLSRRLLLAGADYATEYLSQTARQAVERAGFIRSVEWDYQTSIGERRWQGGVSALGAVRESDENAVAWQLRGYAAEESSAGANAGLIYRHALPDSMVGANIFYDYEQHGGADDAFRRWSVGGEYRSALIDLYVNHYMAFSDSIVKSGGRYYSADGSDIQLNVNTELPHFGELSGGLTYYRWEGQYGDDDEQGLRYHLRFAALSGLLNWQFELDTPDSGSLDWGGRISYRYRLGGPASRAPGQPADDSFDARDYFFDPVRREYAQRIRRIAIPDENTLVRLSVIAGSAVLQPAAAGAEEAPPPVTLTVGSQELVYLRRNALSVTVSGDSVLRMRTGTDWGIIAYENSDFYMGNEFGRLSLSAGSVFLSRSGGNLVLESPNTTVELLRTLQPTLLGAGAPLTVYAPTRLLFAVPPGGAMMTNTIQVYEGRISLAADYATRPAVTIFQSREGERVPLPDSLRRVVDNADLPVGNLAAPLATAEAFVVLSGRPTGVPAQLFIGCSNSVQRANHRLIDGNFAGCAGDALLGGIERDATVRILAQGQFIALTGVDEGGNVRISVAAANQSSTVLWARYPFYPHEGRVISVAVDAEVSYALGSSLTAAVSVSAGSTVNFRYSSEATAGAAAASHPLNVYVLDGSVGDIGSGGRVSCDSANPQLETRAEGQLSVLAACGGRITLADVNALNIGSRVGLPRTMAVAFGGGGTEYRFEILPSSDVLRLENDSGTEATLVLLSDEPLAERYELGAFPVEELSGIVRPVVVQITAHVHEQFSALAFPRVTIRTRLDTDLSLLTIFFQGAVGEVGYPTAPGFTPAANSVNFSIGGRSSGSERVTVSSSSVAITAPITVTVEVAAVDNHADDEMDSTVTVAVEVVAEQPGALTLSTLHYFSTVTGSSGHYVYFSRLSGDRLVSIEVENEGRFSGLGDGGNYRYSVTLSGFTVEAEGSGDRVGVLRLGSADLPDPGAHEVVVVVDDDHEDTAPLTLTLSIELRAPSAALPRSPGRTDALAISGGGSPWAAGMTDMQAGAAAAVGDERVGAGPSESGAMPASGEDGGAVGRGQAPPYGTSRLVPVRLAEPPGAEVAILDVLMRFA